jgi:hypothetical protein
LKNRRSKFHTRKEIFESVDSFGMKDSNAPIINRKLPGPGEYPTKNLYEKIPGSKMGSSERKLIGNKYTHTQEPGPGQYTQEFNKLQHSAPKFGFGTSKRDFLAKT